MVIPGQGVEEIKKKDKCEKFLCAICHCCLNWINVPFSVTKSHLHQQLTIQWEWTAKILYKICNVLPCNAAILQTKQKLNKISFISISIYYLIHWNISYDAQSFLLKSLHKQSLLWQKVVLKRAIVLSEEFNLFSTIMIKYVTRTSSKSSNYKIDFHKRTCKETANVKFAYSESKYSC